MPCGMHPCFAALSASAAGFAQVAGGAGAGQRTRVLLRVVAQRGEGGRGRKGGAHHAQGDAGGGGQGDNLPGAQGAASVGEYDAPWLARVEYPPAPTTRQPACRCWPESPPAARRGKEWRRTARRASSALALQTTALRLALADPRTGATSFAPMMVLCIMLAAMLRVLERRLLCPKALTWQSRCPSPKLCAWRLWMRWPLRCRTVIARVTAHARQACVAGPAVRSTALCVLPLPP